jgi:hypothetical protein
MASGSNFPIGLTSPSYGPSADATDVSFCATQTGTINIGTATRTTVGKLINIGNGVNSTNTIEIGTHNDTLSTGTPILMNGYNISIEPEITQDVNIATTQTSGDINIGTGSRTTTGIINIGNGSGGTNNIINIGGTGSRTTFSGRIFNSLSGYIAGASAGTQYNTNLLPFSLDTTIMNDFIIRFTGSASGTLTVPTGMVAGQRIVVKNSSSGTVTVAFGGTIIITGGTVGVANVALTSGQLVSAMNIGSIWVQT